MPARRTRGGGCGGGGVAPSRHRQGALEARDSQTGGHDHVGHEGGQSLSWSLFHTVFVVLTLASSPALASHIAIACPALLPCANSESKVRWRLSPRVSSRARRWMPYHSGIAAWREYRGGCRQRHGSHHCTRSRWYFRAVRRHRGHGLWQCDRRLRCGGL
jgi:hypothetical protein